MKILFISGVRSGEELEFSVPEITVGRELDNILELPVEGVSRYHGKFVRRSDGNWEVVDLGSTNGVRVNHQLISGASVLQDNDLVAFGDQMLKVSELNAVKPQIRFSEILDSVAATDETPAAAPAPIPIIFNPVGDPPPTPTAAPTPVPPAAAPAAEKRAPATGKSASLTEWRDLLKQGDRMFAAGKPGRKSEAPAASGPEGKAAAVRKRIFNLVFYLSILLIIVGGIAIFHKQEQAHQTRTQTGTEKTAPEFFALRYVKENISADNIFRFELLIENSQARFIIDDVKSNRKFESQPKAISEEALNTLRNDLEQSHFFPLEKQEEGSAANNLDERRRLFVVSGAKRNEVEIVNTSAPRAFLDAEAAINSFADLYGMQTIALTPEELETQAESSYRKGKDLFDNWQAERTNLRDSIQYLQLAVSYLDQFTPKPPVWDRSRKLLEQARKMQERQLQDLKSERSSAIHMNNFAQRREVLSRILDTCDLDSKLYNSAKRELIKLDEAMRLMKGKK